MDSGKTPAPAMSLIAPVAGGQKNQATDYGLCIVCQQQGGAVVLNPRLTSYQNLLDKAKQRADLKDPTCIILQERIGDCTQDSLKRNKAIWHRNCYSNLTNTTDLNRFKVRQEASATTGTFIPKSRGRRSKSADDANNVTEPALPFTRSSTKPLNKQLCFFCQEENGNKVHVVRSMNAGLSLKKAVLRCSNPELKTRFSTCIADGDAHARDLKYHKKCWRDNVFHVLRVVSDEAMSPQNSSLQASCFVELLNVVDCQARAGNYLSMNDIENTYINMLGGKEALENHCPPYNRAWLRNNILLELPHLKKVQKPDQQKVTLLYYPEACEEDMVHMAIAGRDGDNNNMQCLLESALYVRQCIESFKPVQRVPGAIEVTSSLDDVPVELYSMIRWIIAGPEEHLETRVRASIVDQTALTLSQNLMFGFKSKRQVTHKPNDELAGFRSRQVRENPQSVGLALTIHHDTRDKNLLELLNAQGYCISYTRTLMIETALANAVVENTQQFNGLYVPPFLKKGTFVFFAIDNTDFAEDTVDGKGTTHGTVTAIYQRADAPGESITPPLYVDYTKLNSLSVTPYNTPMLQCQKPNPSTYQNERREFNVNSSGVDGNYYLTQLGWVVVSMLSRKKDADTCPIPGWAGYNSLIGPSKPLTHVGCFPLLPEVAHEYSTLLTVVRQALQLKELVLGEDHVTLITFDMALYEKVIKLIDARPELKNKVMPRLGELHVVMCALRALGTSIENSGIDDAWAEADVYSSATTRQILQCTHYKRSLRAHIYSYMALYELAIEQFFKDNPDIVELCQEASNEVEDACKLPNKSTRQAAVQQAHTNLLNMLTSENIIRRLQDWEKQKSQNAMFCSLMNYLHRVEAILFFVSASRNCDLNLHIQAGEALSKLFFAMDRLKYKRLWPRYIADMKALETSHPSTWRELEQGNISVTKSSIPFVSIGADHACEQLNKAMKVHAGIAGISNNANARLRFFLAHPELSKLAKDFKGQYYSENKEDVHHDTLPGKIKQEQETITKIKRAIESHGNPFSVEGSAIYNLITNAYVPDRFVSQILTIDQQGQTLYENYVSERINGQVSLWAPVKKEKNLMYMSGNQKHAVKVRDKVVDLKETKDLYGRLMVLSQSSRDIDQKQAIGTYEFTLTPRSLFTPDGQVLPCLDKSKLIHELEKKAAEPTVAVVQEHQQRIAVVDGMVLVQKLPTRAASVKTVKDLSVCFNERLVTMTANFDEVIVVFDTYKADSLKTRTREQRQQGKDPVKYQVKDETRIQHISLSRFLSHDETKAALTEYLASKTLEYNKESPKLIITSAAGKTKSNKDVGPFPDNNHEEADTLMICLGVSAAQRSSADTQMTFFSPDTDVLVLVIANFYQLPKSTSIRMVAGELQIKPLWNALGPHRARALPGLHAFSGSDNTGRFNGQGKITWFKQFMEADEDVVEAFCTLCDYADLQEDLHLTFAKFVCSAYCPKGIQLSSIKDLRWYLFCKNMAENDKLPPTQGALRQHILRAHVQARVWGQAAIPQQDQLNPEENGYFRDSVDGQLKPKPTDVPAAPDAIVEMVRCQCKKQSCSNNRCSCKASNLPCTDLCLCTTDCENDIDMFYENIQTDADSDSDC